MPIFLKRRRHAASQRLQSSSPLVITLPRHCLWSTYPQGYRVGAKAFPVRAVLIGWVDVGHPIFCFRVFLPLWCKSGGPAFVNERDAGSGSPCGRRWPAMWFATQSAWRTCRAPTAAITMSFATRNWSRLRRPCFCRWALTKHQEFRIGVGRGVFPRLKRAVCPQKRNPPALGGGSGARESTEIAC